MAWVERVERRSQKAKHFYDADTGRYRAEFTIADRHYHTGLAWEDVDETLTDDSNPGFAKRCDKTRHILRVGQGGERRWYPRRNVPGEYVAITETQYWDDSGGGRWRKLNLPAALWKGNKAEWTRADMTFAITNTWRRVKLEINLLSSDAPVRMRFATEFVGLTLDGWDVKSGEEIVGRVDPVTATDADDNSLPAAMTWDGEYIEWSVDATGAAYPITIDPTLDTTPDEAAAFDTMTIRGNADSDQSASTTLGIRQKDATSARVSLIKWDLSGLSGATTTSRTLYLYNQAVVAADQPVTVSRILSANSGWIEACSWNYADGAGASDRWAGDTGNDGGADAGCSISGTDYSGTGMGTFTIVTNDPNGTEYAVSLGQTEFETMVGANYGMALWGTANSNNYLHSSSSATAGYRPRLVVEYTEAASGNPHYAYAQQ